MEKIKVAKKKLLEILTKNLLIHEKEVSEACLNYNAEALRLSEKLLKESLKYISDRNPPIINLDKLKGLRLPENRTEEYETIIEMLELDLSLEIELSKEEFKQYIKNEWDWSGWARDVNTMYVRN